MYRSAASLDTILNVLFCTLYVASIFCLCMTMLVVTVVSNGDFLHSTINVQENNISQASDDLLLMMKMMFVLGYVFIQIFSFSMLGTEIMTTVSVVRKLGGVMTVECSLFSEFLNRGCCLCDSLVRATNLPAAQFADRLGEITKNHASHSGESLSRLSRFIFHGTYEILKLCNCILILPHNCRPSKQLFHISL